jgi:trimethylamine:corrinoid methyltransferase-like protein
MPQKGLQGRKLRLLSTKKVEQIHKTSLRILEEVGISVKDERYLNLFRRVGASVDESEHLRPSTLQDQYDLAWLVEHLDNVHFYQCPVVCNDVSADIVTINSFYAALAGTTKNVQESATNPQVVKDVITMAAMIAGSTSSRDCGGSCKEWYSCRLILCPRNRIIGSSYPGWAIEPRSR